MTYNEREIRNSFSPAKCPCCGKDIMIPKDLTEVFCSFCGKQFLSEAGRQYAAAMTLHGKMQQPKIQVSTDRTSPAHPMPRMMTIRQVAETGVMSETTLRMLLKQKRLPAVYVGNKALINYDRLIEFLSSDSPDPSSQN